MSSLKIKNEDGTWQNIPLMGSYEAVAQAEEAKNIAVDAKNAILGVVPQYQQVADAVANIDQKVANAATSATNASNAADTAQTTATALTTFLNTKETLTAPAVDKMLSISGAAADAKVVGDKIDIMDNFILKKYRFDYSNATTGFKGWFTGYYGDSGSSTTSKYYLRSAAFHVDGNYTMSGAKRLKLTVPSGYGCAIFEFQSNGTTLIKRYGYMNTSQDGWTPSVDILVTDNTHRYALCVGRFAGNNSNEFLNDEFLDQIVLEYYIDETFDKTLSKDNVAANSKTVGDEITSRDIAFRELLTPYYSKVDIPAWHIGGLTEAGGNTTLTSRIRINGKMWVSAGSYVVCHEGYDVAIRQYDAKGVTFGSSGWLSGLTTYCVPQECFISIQVKKTAGGNFALEDVEREGNAAATPYLYLAKQEEVEKLLAGKNIAIFGSSTSTHGSTGQYCNAVEIAITEEDVGVELSAYLTYYDVQNGLTLGGHAFTREEIGNEVTFTPLQEDVGKVIGLANNRNSNSLNVWWTYLMTELGANVIPVAWSGSSITSHEGNSLSLKTSYAWHDAQIRKCGIRVAGSMERIAPDVIIIKRGTNDNTHTPYVRYTEGYFDNVNFKYPTTDVRSDGYYGFKEGLVLTIAKLREAYPFAKIMLATVRTVLRINYDTFAPNNGIYTYQKMNDAIREVANFMQCDVIELANCGITYENTLHYAPDGTHPNASGHEVIGRKAVAELKAKYSAMSI